MTSAVVLGLGGCVDFELKVSAPTLERLVEEFQIRSVDLASAGAVTTERELVISILDHVRRGGGGEHFVASSATLDAFARRFPRRVTFGGTSVRAGLALSRFGVPSTLHLVSLNPDVRRLLPANCDYVCSAEQNTFYPHIIVQYDETVSVHAGDIDMRAPFPNRLIYVNDPANEDLQLSDQLGDLLGRARFFLISGFNAIRDQRVLDQRLATLRHHMRRLPSEAIVYYEDAGFHEPRFSHRVQAALLDSIDVWGLSEDELQAYLGGPVELLSVIEVMAALKTLQEMIPAPTLVLHTKYWAAALGERASEYSVALEQGIVAAGTRYSYGDEYTDDQLDGLRNRPRRAASVAFAVELEQRMGTIVRCCPSFSLDVPDPTTIGLGDTFVGGFLAALFQETTSWT